MSRHTMRSASVSRRPQTRQRLVRIGKKRDRLESERQRAIDMAIKGVIGEEDARTRIAELKAQVVQAEVELASLDEVPQIIALHPATLTRYIATVDRLAAVLADHAQRDYSSQTGERRLSGRGERQACRPDWRRGVPPSKILWGSMVAEVRYRRSPRQDRPSFLLDLALS
jgi:hypothetical protein